MQILRRVYRFFLEKYRLVVLKKYTTMAGTLVFFLIMSIVPLTFWFTLLIGKLPVNVSDVFDLSVFQSVKEVFLYVQKEAKNATTSISVLLLLTTLYSSTNLFYQMRHSGELIYNYQHQKQGLRMRIGALALMFIVIAMVIVFFGLFAIGRYFFSRYFTGILKKIADYVLLFALAFALVILLNAYICPYKTKLKHFLVGTIFTIGAWSIAVVGFTIYLKISNMDKLYGALSVMIIFLLWLYVMTVCFIIGVILNSEPIIEKRKEDAKRQRKRRSMHKLQ